MEGSARSAGATQPLVLNVGQAARAVGLSRATIYRLMDRGEFAPRVRLSKGRLGFLVGDLHAWAAAMREQRAS